MSAWLDEQEFYELCQQYRHSQEWTAPPTVETFEALKAYIRAKIERELDMASESAVIHEQNMGY